MAQGLARGRDAGAAVQRGRRRRRSCRPGSGSGWRPSCRVKTLIGRLFHIGCTIEGLGRLLHRHGWSVQVLSTPIRSWLRT
ncbi:winged helix-turn-helix domain-containing protein [Nonomuraea wenchangensis]|uniref:winged helix-turn-helix domain-containing protein n=1 Tax=Nonomuraea wenchangensis TaxID=568860 RepID=UPI003413828C